MAGGFSDVENLLTTYLTSGEFTFAYYISLLTEEHGTEPPIPSAVLKALAISWSIERPDDIAELSTQEVFAEAMGALSVVENQVDETRKGIVRAILFASLLKPALFDFNRIARSHLKSLELGKGLKIFSPLWSQLAGLGFDFQVSVDDILELNGQDRQRRTPIALEELERWMRTAQLIRTSYEPAVTIWRKYVYRCAHQPSGHLFHMGRTVLTQRAWVLLASLSP